MWRMLHQTNAIEGAAITVRFSEPLSSMIGKKVIRELESVASAEGFLDKQPLQQFQVHVSPQNADVRQSAATGMIFQHSKLERDPSGTVTPLLARQFIFQPEQLVMQILRYRGWETEYPATLRMMGPALKVASGVVPLSAVRIEYLNRFLFEGTVNQGQVEGLLKPSDLIANHVFGTTDLWHSHTGRFDQIRPESRRLIQVNADLQILNPPHPTAGNRTFALMLAVERQFSPPGLEADPDTVAEQLAEHLPSLHDDIHHLLKQLIDSKFASENKLPQ